MSDYDTDWDDDFDQAVQTAEPQLKPPPMYKVVLLNDDYTPMDFVVQILQMFFKMNLDQATQIMLNIHNKGFGVCGIYTRDIAETKVYQVSEYSHNHGHPLLCTMEEV